MKVFNPLLFLILISFLTGCSTYQGKIGKARDLIEAGRFTDALPVLKKLADEPGNDQLVYILDYATALQVAGQFEDSNKYFLRADKLADIQDYTSLSLETGSFLLGEEMVQYKGEDFEVVLINAMTAINFLSLGNLESAQVEVRRLNEKLRRFRLEAKRKFADNALALYLSAIIYEAGRNWDDAAIAYEQTYKVAPDYPPLREDLIRANLKAKRWDQAQKWKQAFPEVVERPEWKDANYGEVIVIYQNGWGPRKNFRRDNFRFPAMYPVWSSIHNISLSLTPSGNETSQTIQRFRGSEELFSVENVAVASLEDQYAALVARRIGGIIAKEMLAERIRRENHLAGDLALIAMYASDRADLRQWSMLPRSFRVYRVSVPAGDYDLKINGALKNTRLKIPSGGKVFVPYRTFN